MSKKDHRIRSASKRFRNQTSNETHDFWNANNILSCLSQESLKILSNCPDLLDSWNINIAKINDQNIFKPSKNDNIDNSTKSNTKLHKPSSPYLKKSFETPRIERLRVASASSLRKENYDDHMKSTKNRINRISINIYNIIIF